MLKLLYAEQRHASANGQPFRQNSLQELEQHLQCLQPSAKFLFPDSSKGVMPPVARERAAGQGVFVFPSIKLLTGKTCAFCKVSPSSDNEIPLIGDTIITQQDFNPFLLKQRNWHQVPFQLAQKMSLMDIPVEARRFAIYFISSTGYQQRREGERMS